MANRERNKRSARQARARERAAQEAAQAASAPAQESRATKKAAAKPEASKAKAPAKAKSGPIARLGGYLGDVRTEMHRVVWPSRAELTNYSVAVVIALVLFGVAVWAVDTGWVALLVAFTGLRG